MQRLQIVIGVYREENKPQRVLVTHCQDYTVEQHHLISTEHHPGRVPVSAESITECLQKLMSRIIERSIFNAPLEPAAHEHNPELILSNQQLDRDSDTEQWYEAAAPPQAKAG